MYLLGSFTSDMYLLGSLSQKRNIRRDVSFFGAESDESVCFITLSCGMNVFFYKNSPRDDKTTFFLYNRRRGSGMLPGAFSAIRFHAFNVITPAFSRQINRICFIINKEE